MVRNTKAKIGRTNKNYGIDLSNKIDIPKLEDFETRKEFNEWKQKQKSFTSVSNTNYQFVKNEYDVVASKKEINEIKKDTKKAQKIARKLQKQAEEKPFISGGKEQGTVGQRMLQMQKPNTAGIYVPPDFDFNKVRSRQQLEKKKENMKKRGSENFFDERMETMKNNLIKLIEETFNSDADELIDKLKGISPDDFYELTLMFDELNFDYIYTASVDGSETNDYISKLSNYVERYEHGKINMDMKGF